MLMENIPTESVLIESTGDSIGAAGAFPGTFSEGDEPRIKRRRTAIIRGTYLNDHGEAVPAVLKLYTEQAPCEDESEFTIRANERGVGPRLLESARNNILKDKWHVRLKREIDMSYIAAICIEDVGISLDAMLDGAPIPYHGIEKSAPVSMVYPELPIEEKAEVAKKILFDLCWQLDALQAGLEPISHGDIKLSNICVCIYGTAAKDVRATLIDFETAENREARAGTAGETRLYRTLVPNLRELPAAYDAGCMALVNWQLQRRLLTPRDTFDAKRFLSLRTERIFHYMPGDTGPWTAEFHPEQLHELASALAQELSLTDTAQWLSRLSDTRSRDSFLKLVANRNWLDRKDILTLPHLLEELRLQAGASRTVHVALASQAGCKAICDKLASFIQSVIPDLADAGIALELDVLSPIEAGAPFPSPRPETFCIALIDDPSSLATEISGQAHPLDTPDVPPDGEISQTGEPVATEEIQDGTGARIHVCLHQDDDKAREYDQLLQLYDAHPNYELLEYQSVEDIVFYLFLILGGLHIDPAHLEVRIGTRTFDITQLGFYRQYMREVRQEYADAEEALLKATIEDDEQDEDDGPDAQAERRKLAAGRVEQAKDAYDKRSDAIMDVLVALSDLLDQQQDAAVRARIERAYRELRRGNVERALEPAPQTDQNAIEKQLAISRSANAVAEEALLSVRSHYTILIVNELIAALAARLMPLNPNAQNAYEAHLRKAARIEKCPHAREAKVTTDACERYGFFLEFNHKLAKAFKWYKEARKTCSVLVDTDQPIFLRRLATTLFRMTMVKIKLDQEHPMDHHNPERYFDLFKGVMADIKPNPEADRRCRFAMTGTAFDGDGLLARAYSSLGMNLVQKGEDSIGLRYIECGISRVQDDIDNSERRVALVHALNNDGKAWLTIGDRKRDAGEDEKARSSYLKAHSSFKQAIDFLDNMRDDHSLHRTRRFSLHEFADVHQRLHNHDDALNYALKSLREARICYRMRPEAERDMLVFSIEYAIQRYDDCVKPGQDSRPERIWGRQVLIDELDRRTNRQKNLKGVLAHSDKPVVTTLNSIRKIKSKATELSRKGRPDDALEVLERGEDDLRMLIVAATNPTIMADPEDVGLYAVELSKVLYLRSTPPFSRNAKCQIEQLDDALKAVDLAASHIAKFDEQYQRMCGVGTAMHPSSAETLLLYTKGRITYAKALQYDQNGKYDEAKAALEQAIAFNRTLCENNTKVYALALATSLSKLGDLLSKERDKHSALVAQREALRYARIAYKEGMMTPLTFANRLICLGESEYVCKEGVEEAPGHVVEGTEILKQLYREDPSASGCSYANGLKVYAAVYLTHVKRTDDLYPIYRQRAIDAASKAVDTLETMFQNEYGEGLEVRMNLVNAYDQLAECLSASDDPDEEKSSWEYRWTALDDNWDLIDIMKCRKVPYEKINSQQAALCHQLRRLEQHLKEVDGTRRLDDRLNLKQEECRVWGLLVKHARSKRRRYAKNHADSLVHFAKLVFENAEKSREAQFDASRGRTQHERRRHTIPPCSQFKDEINSIIEEARRFSAAYPNEYKGCIRSCKTIRDDLDDLWRT